LKMKWDFENKLLAADTDNDSVDDIFYKFDALGRRVGRDDGTANVVYFQDGQQTIADYPSGTAAGSPIYTYVYASYIDEPVMRGGSGGLRYYHRNQQYSITAVSDGGGAVVERYAYSAYGQVTIADASGSEISGSAIANRYTYTGREWDQGLSLYHYRARMFDPVGGRFVSRDPIGFTGSRFGLYEYVSGRPSLAVDPSGLYGGWGGSTYISPTPSPKPTGKPEPIEFEEADWPATICNYFSDKPRPVVIKPDSPLHNKIFNSPSFAKCRAKAKKRAGEISGGMGSELGCWDSESKSGTLEEGCVVNHLSEMFTLGKSYVSVSIDCTAVGACYPCDKGNVIPSTTCKITYTIRDSFTDPLDGSVIGFPFEIPGGTAFPMDGDFEEDFGGCLDFSIPKW
jgi:RHS repeat-associated protein